MDRARLAEKGIFIEDGDGGCELLPPHVESLQDALLDFRRTIPDKFGFSEEEILKLLTEDGTNARDDIPGDDNAEISNELGYCAGIRELTNHLVETSQILIDGYGEDDWKEQFDELLLDTLVEDAQVLDGDTRQTARAKFYYDSFQQARDRPWTLFGPDGSEGKQGDLPEPKPGWVAHFPVYVISPAEYNHQHSGLQQFASSHSIVDNFSQVTLEHLAGHGLQPSATGVTETGRRGAALSSEHDLQSLGDIPPVVTITVRRDLVRVWIMHSSSSQGTCEMQVIWRGSLTRMVDILELRAILDNCETWATRVLRPWISRQIDLWKQQCPDDCPRPFDASLRRRAMQSRNSSNRPTSDEDVFEKQSNNENKDVDLRQMIREEHDWLLQQLLKDPVETKRPTRSMGTQTGPEDKTHPLEKSAVQPMTLNPRSAFPPRKILDPKPRLTKTTTPSGPSLSSDKGEFAPTSTQQEKHDRQRQVKSVDPFKKRRFVSGATVRVAIKLPDVSSEEILAKKPWLGTMERFGVEKQVEMALTQRIQEKKAYVEENEIEKDKAKEQDDNGTRDKDNETEGDETKAKSDDDKDDDGSDDQADDEEEVKEPEPTSPLKEVTEDIDTGSTLATDDKGDPPIDIAEAAPIPEGEDAKGDSTPEPLTSLKDSSPYTTEMAENERSGEVAKEETPKENPEETIEIERTETDPEKNFDEIIDKANSEKSAEKEEKADPAKTMEKEKLDEVIKQWIAEDSPNEENPKETIEKEYFGKSVVGESSDQTTRRVRVPLPQLTPEPGTEVPGQLYWRDLFDQWRENDNHMGLNQSALKQDTPPQDEPAEPPREQTPNPPQAVKSKLSPPAETKPSTVFDATQWTNEKFAFGSSAFTFKMEMEGSAEDPRNSSIPRTQAKSNKLFDWPKEEDDDGGPALSENPRPPKQIKGSGSLARTGEGQ
ncbi:hypothetical protein Neosp_004108 [[Neocosmospora] mangrovei]